MQIGEVDLGAARTVERLDVALQLDQVAGDEARGEPEVPQDLHQQPAAVAARAAFQRQRLLGCLHTGLEPHQVGDVALHPLVQGDQEVRRLHRRARNRGDVVGEGRRRLVAHPVRREFALQRGVVLEGKVLGRGFEEEIERVEHRHLGDEVDLDAQQRRLVGEDESRQVVGLRVLLPVDEVRLGLDAHRIAQDAGARMRRGPQPDDLRPERDRTVVRVTGDVV